ncbi:MAG: cation-translocating P-type ATPase [Planctomycetes bacterium]|nr:cation-translocating P-type ATPase [Planctomycetota bacterium]
MSICDYCRGPITGAGHSGRPWPGRAASTYCCFGCLSLGEQQEQLATSQSLPPSGWKLDGLGIRLGIALLVVGQSMIFGLALNLHDDVPPDVRWITQSLILLATLVVIGLLGPPLFRTAWHEFRRGRVTIEALFLLTMTGAMAASLQAHITGHGKIYYEVVSILLVVYTLGKVIGSRSRAVALAGARAWAGQLETCRLVDAHGRTRTASVTEVLRGDVVEVNPGETFAVDGVIREGVGFITEAAVTGEPFAVVRRPGDRVLAGAASNDATFRIEATAPGTERQVDRLIAAVDAASDKPVSLQAQADALGQWFFPLVVLTAFGTFGYWTLFTSEGWEAALFNAMSVLLVACPCVIGLATPIVIWSALGRLAERGVIVRAGDAVERLAEVDCVMFDKTGTLTDDSFALLDIATTSTGDDRAKLLGWLSVIQERSNHPVARPFAKLPRPFASRVDSLRVIPGCGVVAEIDANGVKHLVHIGTPQWISQNLTPQPPSLERKGEQSPLSFWGRGLGEGLSETLRASGHRIDIALDGELVACAVLAEQLRDSTPQALAGFRRLGLPVEVLTGDTAERAAILNLPARSGLLPDDKRLAIEAAKASGKRPLFVGDGINDAAALASAHVGIALASGTDIAVGAADVTLYHNDLRLLPWAVELSREAVRAVRRNMLCALCYNLFGMTLAACGILHPVAAVVLMLVSSLSLIFSSTRVGVSASHCSEEPGIGDVGKREAETPQAKRALLHGFAFGLQGATFLLLLSTAREWPAVLFVLGGFAVVGGVLAYLWNRWTTIPHSADMCFGMLTLGNLGMLLGWWADAGFSALSDHGCCRCVEAMRGDILTSPCMWIGMLLFANAAMLWLPRRSGVHSGNHAAAMYTGGNFGMVLGMIAGGWCASQFETDSMSFAVVSSFAGMTAGMLVGMLLGTWLTERVLGFARLLLLVPRWLRTGNVSRSA